MKKQIAILAVAASTLTVSAAPTVYGKINKVIGYTSQEDVQNRASMNGIDGVQNSQTRIGVKGNTKMLHMDTTYQVELGLNSGDFDGAGTEQIRIRQANLTMKSKFGSVTLGQAFTPLATMAMKSDSLQGTVASFKGNDQASKIKNASNEIGFEYQSRKDGFIYTTPTMMGLNYTISQYRKDLGNDKAANTQTKTEHLVRYQRDMGNMNMDIYVGLRKTDDGTKATDENMMYGANLGFGAFGLNLGMSAAEDQASATGSTKLETERVYAGLTYDMDAKTKFAFTYQTREDSDSLTATNDMDYTQMAFNVAKKCTDMATVNLTVLKYEAESKNTALTGDAKLLAEADATQVSLGLQIKF